MPVVVFGAALLVAAPNAGQLVQLHVRFPDMSRERRALDGASQSAFGEVTIYQGCLFRGELFAMMACEMIPDGIPRGCDGDVTRA